MERNQEFASRDICMHASAPSCSAPPSGQVRHFDNRSVLQSRPPFDVKALIAGRREPFGFASEACRLLHEACTMPPGTGVFGSPRCRMLRVDCATALARRACAFIPFEVTKGARKHDKGHFHYM